ncbi:hypothetical protein GCM10017562_00960 [Streptomyces roseofulvus]|uniref:hypothetical protein n=1 Tax=Streptomyces roseofulvus TaxID=33902 RepID=UPI0031F7DE9D
MTRTPLGEDRPAAQPDGMTCVRVGAGRCLRRLRLRGEQGAGLLLYVMTVIAAAIVLAALTATLVGTR